MNPQNSNSEACVCSPFSGLRSSKFYQILKGAAGGIQAMRWLRMTEVLFTVLSGGLSLDGCLISSFCHDLESSMLLSSQPKDSVWARPIISCLRR